MSNNNFEQTEKGKMLQEIYNILEKNWYAYKYVDAFMNAGTFEDTILFKKRG